MLEMSSKMSGAWREFEYASQVVSARIIVGTTADFEVDSSFAVDIVDHATGWRERYSLQPTIQNISDQFKKVSIERLRPITHTDRTSSELSPYCLSDNIMTASTIPRPFNEMGTTVANVVTAMIPASAVSGIEMPKERYAT
jgi:hypothetical protein